MPPPPAAAEGAVEAPPPDEVQAANMMAVAASRPANRIIERCTDKIHPPEVHALDVSDGGDRSGDLLFPSTRPRATPPRVSGAPEPHTRSSRALDPPRRRASRGCEGFVN